MFVTVNFLLSETFTSKTSSTILIYIFNIAECLKSILLKSMKNSYYLNVIIYFLKFTLKGHYETAMYSYFFTNIK